ncbi:hypothetical protein [Rhizobium leguminosarum]|nr:hypothetical protein [Rhizobium leguminosarum]MBP2443640.1 hypothetical protein [Rhizobium leguminosarum]
MRDIDDEPHQAAGKRNAGDERKRHFSIETPFHSNDLEHFPGYRVFIR